MENAIRKYVLGNYYRWAVTGYTLIIVAIFYRTMLIPYGIWIRGYATTLEYYMFDTGELVNIFQQLNEEGYQQKIKDA